MDLSATCSKHVRARFKQVSDKTDIMEFGLYLYTQQIRATFA